MASKKKRIFITRDTRDGYFSIWEGSEPPMIVMVSHWDWGGKPVWDNHERDGNGNSIRKLDVSDRYEFCERKFKQIVGSTLGMKKGEIREVVSIKFELKPLEKE